MMPKIKLTINNPYLIFVSSIMYLGVFHIANATDIYKWTDSNGKVHFSDRTSAASNSKKIEVKPQNSDLSTPEQKDTPKPTIEKPSAQQTKSNSKPVDPSKVKPVCQDLIDQIAKVKPGTNWESLANRFTANCPGITYECNKYPAHPENNNCSWVEKNSGDLLRTNTYN